jgi:exodeoxyribonuclease V alpha subunit
VSGRLDRDPRHGERLVAASLVVLAPDTVEGVERYLGSGVVSGIGPVFAKRIVKFFGMDTLAMLDHESHRLAEVPGLGAARIEKIRASWQEHRAISNVLLALQSAGASPALAARIVAHFGERAVQIVQQSPYRLAIELPGVGFQTADAIAQAQGIDRDHPERVQAGVLHELELQAASGHCFTEQAELTARVTELLGVDSGHVLAAIDLLFAKERLIVEGELVFPSRLHRAETAIERRVRRLLGAPTKAVTDFASRLESFEQKNGIVLAGVQKEAVAAAASGKFVVITGGPGVGKTTIVRAILAVLEGRGLRVALAAPTGRAAKRLSESTGQEAVTLHRLLSMNPGTGRFERNEESPLELDLLIVDEASMIDVRLAESLLLAVPDASRVVFVGDVDQLPSVGPGAFLSDLIESGIVPVQRLNVIFRQGEESGIISGSHAILRGEKPRASKSPEGDFFVIEARQPERAKELVLQLVTQRIPSRFGFDPRSEVQVLSPMHRGEAGTRALSEALQDALNPSGKELRMGDLVLREGDKVLQVKNDYDKGVFNGDVGEVLRIDLENLTVQVGFEDDRGSKVVSYQRNDLGQLKLAYAMSIHKSQGSEYPALVIVFLASHFVMLSKNLLYTAVTRAKRLCVLVADPRALSIALGETRRESRRTSLAERLRQTGAG